MKQRPQATAALRTREVLKMSQRCHTCTRTTQHPGAKCSTVHFLQQPLMKKTFSEWARSTGPNTIHFTPLWPSQMNTKVLALKFTNCVIRLDTRTILTIYSFLDRVRKFHTEILEIILVEDLLETMAQVCRLQQHSTGVGLFRFVTKQPKCLMCTASGVKREVFG